MRLAFCPVILATGLFVAFPAYSQSNSPWSPLSYKTADGWTWDVGSGMWRNPRPVLDKTTGKWVYQTRHPSSTACCDKTGLSFPMGSVNEKIGEAEPPQRKKVRPSKLREALRAKLRAKLARPVDDVDADIAGINAMQGVPQAAKDAVIKDLERKRSRRSGERPTPQARQAIDDDAAETSQGAGSSLYGQLAGQSSNQLENTARNRRRDSSNDPTLGSIVGAGLAAGVAIGSGIRAGQVPRSRSTTATTYAPAQPRRTAPAMPVGRDYNPNRSTISGNIP